MFRVRRAVLAVMVLLSGCATTQMNPSGPSNPEHPAPPSQADHARRVQAAAPAVKALQEARFEDALRESSAVLQQDDGNATAHAVWAVAEFRQTLQDFSTDAFTLAMGVLGGGLMGRGAVSDRLADFVLKDADQRLETVEGHLAKAAEDPDFSLDLCLACWKVDWDRSGDFTERDAKLLQVEYDASGDTYPEDDSRRTPTFRFDAADVSWLRAMVDFQRALINGVLAYDLGSALDSFLGRDSRWKPIVIKLRDRSRVLHAKELLLAGLEQARRTRAQVLAETDDEREWLPNPRQQSHPLPLAVDDALFQTWEGVLADIDGLLRSEQGLSVAELAQLGDHRWSNPPQGFIDVGALLSEPGDIVLEPKELDDIEHQSEESVREPQAKGKGQPATKSARVEESLKTILGAKYRPTMKATLLIQRLGRMKGEVERGEESFERKLRYLFWLN